MSQSGFVFKYVELSQKELILGWLGQDYIREWIHGVGLQNTLEGLDRFFKGESDAQYWIGYQDGIPFAFLITARIEKDVVALDVFICNADFLGKGLSVPMIHEFLMRHFSEVNEVLIDPEMTNTRAVHVYQKAGFKIVGEFIASWHPVPHYKMQLQMKDLLRGKR